MGAFCEDCYNLRGMQRGIGTEKLFCALFEEKTVTVYDAAK